MVLVKARNEEQTPNSKSTWLTGGRETADSGRNTPHPTRDERQPGRQSRARTTPFTEEGQPRVRPQSRPAQAREAPESSVRPAGCPLSVPEWGRESTHRNVN